jgi:hypothetical protein
MKALVIARNYSISAICSWFVAESAHGRNTTLRARCVQISRVSLPSPLASRHLQKHPGVSSRPILVQGVCIISGPPDDPESPQSFYNFAHDARTHQGPKPVNVSICLQTPEKNQDAHFCRFLRPIAHDFSVRLWLPRSHRHEDTPRVHLQGVRIRPLRLPMPFAIRYQRPATFAPQLSPSLLPFPILTPFPHHQTTFPSSPLFPTSHPPNPALFTAVPKQNVGNLSIVRTQFFCTPHFSIHRPFHSNNGRHNRLRTQTNESPPERSSPLRLHGPAR